MTLYSWSIVLKYSGLSSNHQFRKCSHHLMEYSHLLTSGVIFAVNRYVCFKEGGFCKKGRDGFSLGFLSSWRVSNVTTVTFHYILVIVLLFPLNVGVSPCFHCTILVLVYRVHTSCLHHAGVTSCFSLNIWFQFILEMCH